MLQIDPWLEPFKDTLKRRYNKAKDWIKTIDQTEGGLNKFSQVCRTPMTPSLDNTRCLTPLQQGADIYGFHVDGNNNVVYREWAPNAQEAFLIGDFSETATKVLTSHLRVLTCCRRLEP